MHSASEMSRRAFLKSLGAGVLSMAGAGSVTGVRLWISRAIAGPR